MKALLLTLVIAFTGSFASASTCTKANGTAINVNQESGAWTKKMATKIVPQGLPVQLGNQIK